MQAESNINNSDESDIQIKNLVDHFPKIADSPRYCR